MVNTYFSRITADHWTAKNKLEKAAHVLAKKMDRILIKAVDLDKFNQDFQNQVDELNAMFPRCKPLRFSIERTRHYNGDVWIYCDGVFDMSLFGVEKIY